MTIQGAIAELQNLLEVDDVPFYYKGGIEKVIETIRMEMDLKQDCDECPHARCLYEADRKTEPTVSKMEQVEWTKEDCKGCKYNEYPYDSGTCFVRVCINGNKYEPKTEPQTERSEK